MMEAQDDFSKQGIIVELTTDQLNHLLKLFDDEALHVYVKDANLRYVTKNKTMREHLQLDDQPHKKLSDNETIIPPQSAALFQEQDKYILKYRNQHHFIDSAAYADEKHVTFFTTKFCFNFRKQTQPHILGFSIPVNDPELHKKISDFLLFEKVYLHDHAITIAKMNLTSREWQCFYFLIRLYSAQEIADCLFLSKRTVEDHIERLKNKLGCHSRRDIVEFSHAHQLFYFVPEAVLTLPKK